MFTNAKGRIATKICCFLNYDGLGDLTRHVENIRVWLPCDYLNLLVF